MGVLILMTMEEYLKKKCNEMIADVEALLKALEDTKNSEGLDGAYYVCFYGNQLYLFSTKAIK